MSTHSINGNQMLPEQTYTERAASYAGSRARYSRRSSQMANVNLALFTGAIIALGLAFWQDESLWLLLSALLSVGFVVAYSFHGWIDRQVRRLDAYRAINEEGLFRLHRDWNKLPLRQANPPADHTLPHDLDLLGHASLQHLLSATYTPIGAQTLQEWLLQPAEPSTIRARQAAVRELAPRLEFREELAWQGRDLAAGQRNFERFEAWAAGPAWLRPRSPLRWLVRLLTLATLLAVLAHALGATELPLWIPLVAVNLGLVLTIGRQVDEILDTVVARQGVFGAYAALFGLLGSQHFESEALRAVQQNLHAGNHSAEAELRRLSRIMALADFRRFMLYLPIQLVTLWNFHVLDLLEGWQRRAGPHVGPWLAALGQTEALAALATLAHDEPDWVFPVLRGSDAPKVEARALGHPLIAPKRRVDNDVGVGPPGTLLLVTGSNMSGKSTLLRAIGLNVVLAQAGGPACAAALELPPLLLATSMRVEDSLEEGVSYFMAEIRRLKAVVDRAEATRQAGDRTLLYLLDEILHGTNTGERQIAARQILRHLLALGAIGVVSTHDLALADVPDLAEASERVHFAEQFSRGPDGPQMHFDYRLRPGIATSTNALKLMELIGLPVREQETAIDRVEQSDP